MTQELAVPQLSTTQLISNARRALAEARTLPDFRKVMEAASVAADAGKRAAKLMEAQGVAAEVVRQANDAANDAAAVRIEAQAGAGRILREMQESGQRLTKAEGPARRADRVHETEAASKPSLADLVGGEPNLARANASKWQKVGDIPDNVRVEYVDATKEEGGEITTKGLLRYAATKQDDNEDADEHTNGTQEALERAYDNVTKAMAVLTQYRNAGAIAAYAADSRRKTRFRELVNRTRAWTEEAEEVLK